MSWSRSWSIVETRCRLLSSRWIGSFLSAMLEESRETPDSAALNSSGVLRVRSERVVRDWGQLVGVDLVGGLGEAGERLDDVVRRARPLDRDLLAGGELAGAGRLQCEVHGAEQGVDPDRGAGLGAEVGVGLDPEGHLHVVALELDRLDACPTRTPAIRTGSLVLSPPASENAAV